MKLLWIALGVFVLLIIFNWPRDSASKKQRVSTGKPPSSGSNKSKSGKSKEDLSWMDDRWKEAEQHHQERRYDVFPKWYFDDATESQLTRIGEDGKFEVKGNLSKGGASDLIGLLESPDDGEKAILKFFKIPLKGMSQTRARHEISQLFRSPENVESWEKRPPDSMMREEAAFYGVKLPKGCSLSDAQALISSHINSLDEADEEACEKLQEQWSSYEDILDQLSDKDELEMYEIRKPAKTLVKQVIKEMLEGKQDNAIKLNSDNPYEDINVNHMDSLVQRLVQLNPKLEREIS